MQGVGKYWRGPVSSVGMIVLGVSVLMLGFTHTAHAFFPFGAFQADGDVVFAKWSLDTLDRNNDGDVNGDDDGVVMTINVGDNGYNNNEIPTIIESFNVWENLPGSYIAFTFTAPISDAIPFGAVDGFNSVTTFAQDEDGVDDGGVVGISTSFLFLEDNSFIVVPGTDFAVAVRSGEILETDIIVGAQTFRNAQGETDDLGSLKGTLVHEIGHSIGLGHNPMNNFTNIADLLDGGEADDTDPFDLEEDAIIAMRDGTGQLRTVGVTPTMFPFVFGTLDPLTELFYDGSSDLAYDDVSAAHFLYPRQGQVDDYFALHEQARRNLPSLEGIPSPHITGGLVTAYVDHDNNEGTGRVPLISTMTGLYTNGSNNGNLDLDGRFSLFGIPKQLESGNGVLFDATYTFTLTRIGDVIPFQSPQIVDTMHNTNGEVDARAGELYDTSFISSVFNENGDLLDSTLNLAGGTPLKFDSIRRQIISVDSGKTIDQILPGATPMFGTSPTESTCPLDIILVSGTTGTGTGTDGQNILPPNQFANPITQLGAVTSIRSFRDMWLFKNSAGRLVVDGYYRLAPPIARFLSSHHTITNGIRAFIASFSSLGWLVLSFWAVVTFVAAWKWSRGKKRPAAIMRWIGAGLILFACYPAQATTLVLHSTEQLIERSTDVVGAKVLSKRSYAKDNGRIVTDYVFETDDVLKGTMNKSSTFTLTVIGGTIGSFVANVPGLPKFQADEEVLLFLRDTQEVGRVVTGAEQGKLLVQTDPETGRKFVKTKSLRGKRGLPTAKRTDPDAELTKDEDGDIVEPEGLVSLDQYKRYLRDLVNKQARVEE